MKLATIFLRKAAAPALLLLVAGLAGYQSLSNESFEVASQPSSQSSRAELVHSPRNFRSKDVQQHNHADGLCTDPECQYREIPRDKVVEERLVDIDFPAGLPETFEVKFPFEGEEVSLALKKHSVRGVNTVVALDNGAGELIEANLPPVNTYIGNISGRDSFFVAGHVTPRGLSLKIDEDFGGSWSLEPTSKNGGEHMLSRLAVNSQASGNVLRSNECLDLESLSDDLKTSMQGFAPVSFIQGKRAELAADLDYPFARKHLGHPGVPGADLTQAQLDSIAANALSRLETIILTVINTRFERSYAVSWETGFIVVRNDEQSDPYRGTEGRTTFNIARNIWVNGGNRPSTTFDTVITGHGNGLNGGVSGLAANNVAACNGSSIGAWHGVALHEIHHNWGHPHGIGRGSDMTPWGKWLSPSMIVGADTRKANFAEYQRTIGNKNGRGGSLEDKLITINTHPHANWDVSSFVPVGSGNSIVIDVLANDHDANGDDVRILDKFSSHPSTFVSEGSGTSLGVPANDVVISASTHRGGTVELVPGAPGQRDMVRYTPPSSTTATFDVFHYYIEDTNGNEDFGMVKVGLLQPSVVSDSDSSFKHDAGPPSSHIPGSGWRLLSPETTGDVYWSQKPGAVDRFIGNDAPNSTARDSVEANSPRTLNHKIPNGTWDVTVLMGDRAVTRNGMAVKAEGVTVVSGLNAGANALQVRTFRVNVTDGELNLEFSSTSGWWSLNSLQISRPQPTQITVDTALLAYNYDLGPFGAPVQNGWTALEDLVSGDVTWSGDVNGVDRGNSVPTNDINRDFVGSSSTVTLRHKVANGRWAIIMNMGDQTEAHDQMRVSAEGGQVVRENIDSGVGEYPYISMEVNVTDGFIDLEFSDEGGTANGWVLNRLSFTKLVTVDTSITKFDYDLGSEASPIFPDFLQLTNTIRGEISWSANPNAIDRTNVGVINDLNRDMVTSPNPTTLNHKLANGRWSVVINMGDAGEARDQMRVSAEDGQVVRENINAATSAFPYVTFEVDVSDEELNLTFSDEGGNGNGWVVNRLSLQYLGNPDADQDNDQLPDVWENQYFGNLTATAGLPSEDFDGDGLSDRQEFIEETDPTEADSDGDGLNDSDELTVYQTNPRDVDSDDDGFTDGEEVVQRSNPLDDTILPRISGLVAYYPFDEANGTTALDIAPFDPAQNAEQGGGTVTWTTTAQKIGSAALDLDGSSYFLAPNPIPEDATEFTISVWVNPDADGGYKGIYAGRHHPGNWGINVENGHADIRFSNTMGDSSLGLDTPDNSVVANGGWYHIAQTWQTTGSIATGKTYLNGALVQTVTSGLSLEYKAPTLGYFIGNDPCCPGRTFNGQIDDLAVFRRVLTDSEIAQVNAMGNAGQSIMSAVSPPPLVKPEMSDFLMESFNGGSTDVSFRFSTQKYAFYNIYRSEDLTNWELIMENVPGTGQSFQFIDENNIDGKEMLFYRIGQK